MHRVTVDSFINFSIQMLYVTLPDQEDAQRLRIYYIKPGIANRGGRQRLAGGHGRGLGSGAGAAAELQPDAGDNGSLPAGADHALPAVAQAAAAVRAEPPRGLPSPRLRCSRPCRPGARRRR